MITVAQNQSVGTRVAATRRLAGWTQQKLAQQAHVSASLISQVERGVAPPSPAFISACAQALGVGYTDLTETPSPMASRSEHRVHAGIPAIRRELATYRIAPEDIPMRPYLDLVADVAKASQLRHGVQLSELGEFLPALLHDLRVGWNSTTGPDQERIFGLLAETYSATGQLVYKLGYADLASLAVDRYEWAAAQSGDELAVLAGDYQRAGEMICAADWLTAEQVLTSGRRQIEDQLSEGDPKTLSMWGNLHLKSGLAAARSGRLDLADDHLAEAAETAERIGEDRDDYRLCFGPTNVSVWSVGLAVEAMDGTEAVKRAEKVTLPAGTPRERMGHHYIDLARGFLLHGDREGAFSALQVAKRIAPTQTRYHPMVHETIRMLARQETRASETVRGFAAWCGINSID
ncbi:helix-turn-helix domain-containing protein [Nocardia nova]|uniref:helix-turn-helix domain-containing protein n=1 Tax=Nocardia nova TaxID=37330 RepID=UPI003411735F